MQKKFKFIWVVLLLFIGSVAGADVMGEFVDVGQHNTKGSVTISAVEGGHLLTLSEDFDTEVEAPDLRILLHKEAGEPMSYDADEYYQVDFLDSHGGQVGKRQYFIPSEVDIMSYQSVVIWCKRFDVTFGYAVY